MSHLNYTTKNRKGKHLNYEERIKIEALSKIGLKSEAIAKQIGCSGQTVRRELAKGRTTLLNSDLTAKVEYSADIGQQKHNYAGTAKGPTLKIGNDYELVEYIEKLIIDEHMSPYYIRSAHKQDKSCSPHRMRDVVKDLSRFGRNYLDAGEYIEKIFPFLGVRFIAVNDNFDTLTAERTQDGYIVPLKNLINEVYSKDISKKIDAVLTVKQQRGEFIGAWAPYGYRKDPNDKHHLVINEETAPRCDRYLSGVPRESALFRSGESSMMPVSCGKHRS